jgi:hypothetical protein
MNENNNCIQVSAVIYSPVSPPRLISVNQSTDYAVDSVTARFPPITDAQVFRLYLFLCLYLLLYLLLLSAPAHVPVPVRLHL